MIDRFLVTFRKELAKRLVRKTNWGRNELMIEIEASISEALADLVRSFTANQ